MNNCQLLLQTIKALTGYRLDRLLPPSLHACCAAETCSIPQNFNGGSKCSIDTKPVRLISGVECMIYLKYFHWMMNVNVMYFNFSVETNMKNIFWPLLRCWGEISWQESFLWAAGGLYLVHLAPPSLWHYNPYWLSSLPFLSKLC